MNHMDLLRKYIRYFRIILLAFHDFVLGVKRREVYRYEHSEWVFKGLEANDWVARLLVGKP